MTAWRIVLQKLKDAGINHQRGRYTPPSPSWIGHPDEKCCTSIGHRVLDVPAQTGADHFPGRQQGQDCKQDDAAPCYRAKDVKRRPVIPHVIFTSRFASAFKARIILRIRSISRVRSPCVVRDAWICSSPSAVRRPARPFWPLVGQPLCRLLQFLPGGRSSWPALSSGLPRSQGSSLTDR
jgi:hypothetical protein